MASTVSPGRPILGFGRGFTVIELLAALILVGLIMVFVLPKLSVTRYQVDGAMHAAGTRLLTVQRTAVTRQHNVIVLFDAPNNALKILEDKNNNYALDGGERIQSRSLGDQVVFGLGGANPRPMGAGPITYTRTVAGLPALVFYRDGSASQAGGFYVTSRRAAASPGTFAQDTRAIETDRATGRPYWFRYSAPTWKRAF
ncbi:MAG: pilus assembly FimT family protein [Gemmatimonadales bacterium]